MNNFFNLITLFNDNNWSGLFDLDIERTKERRILIRLVSNNILVHHYENAQSTSVRQVFFLVNCFTQITNEKKKKTFLFYLQSLFKHQLVISMNSFLLNYDKIILSEKRISRLLNEYGNLKKSLFEINRKYIHIWFRNIQIFFVFYWLNREKEKFRITNMSFERPIIYKR